VRIESTTGKAAAAALLAALLLSRALDPLRRLKQRSGELMNSLRKTLRADWGQAFVRVTSDERGVLLLLFAGERLPAERAHKRAPERKRHAPTRRGPMLARARADGLRRPWRVAAAGRADLHMYMNRLLSTHPVSSDFGVQREPSRWGVVQPPKGEARAAASEDIVYALRPPWVANDLLTAHQQQLEKHRGPITLTTSTLAGAEEATK
jgi:hypothetical protein